MTAEIVGLAAVVVLLFGVVLFGHYFEPRVFPMPSWRQIIPTSLWDVEAYLLAVILGIAWWLWAS